MFNAKSLDLDHEQQQGMISADQLHTNSIIDDIRLHNSKAQSQPYWRRKLHKRWQSSKARSSNEENGNTNSKAGEISYSYEDLVNYEVPVGKLLDDTTNERRDCNTEPSKPPDIAVSSFVKKQCKSLQLVDNLSLLIEIAIWCITISFNHHKLS